MGKQWKQWQTIFLGSKITVNSDCSHEMKICLLLGRKTMTNLDSILKSRDIVLLTKIRIVKAMVFLSSYVWMWELDHKESWAPKNWCYWTVVLKKSLESPWTTRRSNQPILQIINPEYSLDGLLLKLKLQYFGHCEDPTHWKNPDAEKDWGQEEKGAREDEMVGWHHQLNGHEFEQIPGDSERQGSLACCSPWGRKESDMT